MNFVNQHWHDFVAISIIILSVATAFSASTRPLSMPLFALGAGILRPQPGQPSTNNSSGDTK